VVLAGFEQGLRVGVVVAHRGAAEGGDDPQPLQGGKQSGAFHRRAIVGVQDQRLGAHPFAQMRLAEHDRGLRAGLLGVDLPAHDLAAEDIEDEVEIKELPGHEAGQVSDVPAPDLVRAGGAQWLRAAVGRRLSLAPLDPLPLIAQDAVEGRFRGDVFSLVGQGGHDLENNRPWPLSKITGPGAFPLFVPGLLLPAHYNVTTLLTA
jgi:hypothetical protein